MTLAGMKIFDDFFALLNLLKLKLARVQFNIRETSTRPRTLRHKLCGTMYLYDHTTWLSIYMQLST